MAIPESQLETWANPGAVTTAKATADSVKKALNSYTWPDGVHFEVYLQGSYKNTTNIRANSDVDVVAQLNSTFYYNLSENQKITLGITPASYSLPNFETDVLNALRNYYGNNQITEGNKTLKLRAGSGRLPADIVVCSQYRRYETVSDYDYIEGMCFWPKNGFVRVINYPKFHYNNGVSKHQGTSEWYKPAVRMFKNMRGENPGDETPSYFLECLIYNVPASKFGISYEDSFCDIVNWLNKAHLDSFMCNNGQQKLFGSSSEQWDTAQAQRFVGNLISLWNKW